MDRIDVLRAALAYASTPRIGVRPWRIEEALAVGTAGDSPAATSIMNWLRPGPSGPSASGLERLLGELHREGALVYGRDWRLFIVDPWWRADQRGGMQRIDVASRQTLLTVASEWDRLEARREAHHSG
jgi:hypothetical protein